jgi:hypothetical protein
MLVHTSNSRCSFCQRHLTIVGARREPGCLDILATRGCDIAPTLPSEFRFCSAIERSPCCKIIRAVKNTFKAVRQSCARRARRRCAPPPQSATVFGALRPSPPQSFPGLKSQIPSDARRGSDPGDVVGRQGCASRCWNLPYLTTSALASKKVPKHCDSLSGQSGFRPRVQS